MLSFAWNRLFARISRARMIEETGSDGDSLGGFTCSSMRIEFGFRLTLVYRSRARRARQTSPPVAAPGRGVQARAAKTASDSKCEVCGNMSKTPAWVSDQAPRAQIAAASRASVAASQDT